MVKLIILRGYPGSGKTTVGNALQVKGVGRFIDHNAILTFIAGITVNDDGIYDDIASLELAMTRKLLKEGSSVIVARGFSDIDKIKPYEDIASELGIEYKIVRLDVGWDELETRVQSDTRLEDFNPTTTPEALNKWIKQNPLIDHPSEILVSNTQPIEDVVAVIIGRL